MTLTATPQPSNIPPRVRLDIDSGDAAASFTELEVRRDGVLIREQPFVGGSEALTFDYEAPFGVPVEYTVEGSYSTYTSTYTTAWPNLTGWSTDAGTPSVAGGYFKGAGPVCGVSRAVTLPSSGRLTLAAPLRLSGGSTGYASLVLGTGYGLNVGLSSDGGSTYVQFGNGTVFITHTSGTLVATWTPEEVTIITPQGTWSITSDWNPSADLVRAEVDLFGQVPGFTVETAAADSPFSDDVTTQLDVDEAWLIHPSQPTLSCSIDPGPNGWREDGINVDVGTKPNLSRRQVATTFNPVGRSRSVVVTHGNRLAGDWTLNLLTPRLEDRDAVQAIITDQTPLLFRAPVDWEWDLPDGWYSVGDVDEARSFPSAGLAQPYRNIVLPLTPVDAPIVRQGALWTWGGVVITYETWEDVRDGNATWLDLLAGPAA